jgi:hypothetical protein
VEASYSIHFQHPLKNKEKLRINRGFPVKLNDKASSFSASWLL